MKKIDNKTKRKIRNRSKLKKLMFKDIEYLYQNH